MITKHQSRILSYCRWPMLGIAVGSVFVLHCGGQDELEPEDTSAGGGDGGTAGSAGSAGSAGTAGSAGFAGAGGTQPEGGIDAGAGGMPTPEGGAGAAGGTMQTGWLITGGGGDADAGLDIAQDNAGYTYVVGFFSQSLTLGSAVLTAKGGRDGLVVKVSPDGDVVWAKGLGGAGSDEARAVGLDAQGNLYLCGTIGGHADFDDFSIEADAQQGFVASLSPDGSFRWATGLGGPGPAEANSLYVSDGGNTFVTGGFMEDAGFGNTVVSSAGGVDIFLSEVSAEGVVESVFSFGGTAADKGLGIGLDDQGAIFLAGYFEEEMVVGSTAMTSKGSIDAYLIKLSAAGEPQWATSGGGPDWDGALGLTVTGGGDAIITGYFTDDAIWSGTSLASRGLEDFFVARFSPDGDLAWVQAGGSEWDERAGTVTVDIAGNIYVGGLAMRTSTFGSYTATSAGLEDAFIARLSQTGTPEGLWMVGGPDYDEMRALVVGSDGDLYGTGFFSHAAAFESHAANSNGGLDVFIWQRPPLP